MPFEDTLISAGAESTTIDCQLAGFYYTFGTFSMQEWVDDDGMLYSQCVEIQSLLAHRFLDNLRALPQWNVIEFDMVVEPFEICADDLEAEEINERPAFSLWIYHGGGTIPLENVNAFRQALFDAIKSLSLDTNEQVKIEYLKAVTDTFYRLRKRDEISLDD